ncbi:MAG: hypothetical protein PHQ74_07050 [Crocinitomicaceae bacterium]|nr:hypothetical protein [Crocinitomicaceae bacterium]
MKNGKGFREFMHLCMVDFLNLAFRLGVVFAIFSFLWGILNMILNLIRGQKPQSVWEEYGLKIVQYFLLVNVVFLFSVHKNDTTVILPNELMTVILILILYFSGKLQKQKRRSSIIESMGSNMPRFDTNFNLRAEVIVISLSILFFTAFIFFPHFAVNPIANWFYTSILEIEALPLLGFIFKIIGFFVLMSILMKIINGFAYLFSGAPLITVNSRVSNQNNSNTDENNFDDFEEMK